MPGDIGKATMSWRDRLSAVVQWQWERSRAWLSPVPSWLLVAAGILIGVVPALSLNITKEVLPAVLALLGVMLGGAIAAGTSIAIAHAARRAQVVAATWSRRVEAHQAGFELWWRLKEVIHDSEKRGTVILDAQEWWSKNCLYLSEDARTEFKLMINRASTYARLVETGPGTDSENAARLIEKIWENIDAVGPIIAQGAGCHLSDQLLDELKSKHPA